MKSRGVLTSNVCDVRVGWVLQGCIDRWNDRRTTSLDELAARLAQPFKARPVTLEWIRYVEAGLPAAEVARRLRIVARSLAAENVHAEHFRAKAAFGLQN